MNKYNFILHVIIPLILGASIYLFFRTPELIFYQWLGITDEIHSIQNKFNTNEWGFSAFLIYNIPDGLWAFSFMASLHILLSKQNTLNYLISLFACLFCIINECLPLFFNIGQTFDFKDIYAILLFQIFYLTLKNKNYEKISRCVIHLFNRFKLSNY